jgi:hypothetical protein
VWQPLVAFVVGTAIGVALPAVMLAARNACRGADLSLRATAFSSLLAANGTALAGGALVAWIAGRHEVAIAASSVACGLAIVVFLPGGREREQGGLLRAYALSFAPPFVLFALLGAGLAAF